MNMVQAHRPNSEYRADTIYFFVSVDGVHRHRCGRHMPQTIPTAATFIWRREKAGSSRSHCIECYWAQHNKMRGGEDNLVDNWE